MKKRRRRFRNQEILWVFLILIAVAAGWERYCRESSAFFCLEGHAAGAGSSLLLVLLIPLLIIFKRLAGAKGKPGFKHYPERFDGKVVVLTGRVEHILPDTPVEIAKRKVVDYCRTVRNDENAAGRYLHQRFLLSSAELKRGECLLVEHNTNFGKVKLKKGQRVEVKGVYLHTAKKGSHFYGRIHFTHVPKGSLKVLPKAFW